MGNEAKNKLAVTGNRVITNFFKPRPQPKTQLKRPAPAEPIHNSIEEQSRRSKSPRLDNVNLRGTSSRPSSSAISDLTPIASDATVEPPSDSIPHRARGSDASTQSARSSSSLPTAASSSQRLLKHGEIVVTNSDGESESDNSLAEIDEILRPKQNGMPSSPLTELDSSEPELPTRTPIRPKPIQIPPPTSRRLRSAVKNVERMRPPDKKYKFSLQKLLDRTERGNAEDEAYKKALSLVNELDSSATVSKPVVDSLEPSEKLTAEALALKIQPKDPEDVDKLVHALQRTEALRTGSSWSFLGGSSMACDIPPFPPVESQPWKSWAHEPLNREIAFLCGNIADLAAIGLLPREVSAWILDYCLFEPREDLRLAYFLVLEKDAAQLHDLIDPDCLSQIISTLGACSDVLDLDTRITPKVDRSTGSDVDSTNRERLSQYLYLVSRIARNLSNEARSYLLYLLLCMALDSSLITESNVLHLLQDAMAACLPDIEGAESFGAHLLDTLHIIYDKVDDLELQSQLIRTLPTTSPSCCSLRQRLALSFFFKDPSYLSRDTTSPLLPELSKIAHHLRSQPAFTIRHSMNFQHLAALMSLLDIGIDDGNRPDLSSDKFPSKTNTETEKSFNKQVDDLSGAVRDMFSRIVDSGASHMSRTEAKEVMVALEARLQHAVRTRPRPKKSIFGTDSGAGSSEESKELMKKYLKQKTAAQDGK